MTNYTKEILDIIRTQAEQNNRTLSLMEKLVDLPATVAQTTEEETEIVEIVEDTVAPVKDSPPPVENKRLTFAQIRRMTGCCIDTRNVLVKDGVWNPVKVRGEWTITEDEFVSVTDVARPIDPNRVYFYSPANIEQKMGLAKASIAPRLIAMHNKGEVNAVFIGTRRRYPADEMDVLISAALEGRTALPNNVLIMDNFKAAAKEMKK